MTSKPLIRIHDSNTGEVIDREMTDLEFSEYQAHNQVLLELQEKAEKAKSDAQNKLQALGLTTDDLKALGL